MKGHWLRGNERGTVVLFMLGSLFFLLVFGGFAIDLSFLSVVRGELQRSMDAAALAGAGNLGINDSVFPAVRQEAQRFADLNPTRANLSDLNPTGAITLDLNPGNDPNGDIVLGIWDGANFTSSLDGSQVNAVRCQYATAMPTSFLRILGFNSLPVSAEAIALYAGSATCFDQGVVAGNRVTVGQDYSDLDGTGYCMYGRNGVSFSQDPVLSEDSRIGALDIDTITFGQDPVVPDGVLVELDRQPTLSQSVEDIIDDLVSGAYRPDYITNVVVGSLPSTLVEGTAYIVNGNVSIGQDYQVANVIIAARGNVSWGQDGAIRNSGVPNSGAVGIGVLATGDITVGQDAIVVGANLIAGHDVHIGQDLQEFAVSIQAGNDVTLGQDPRSSGFAASFPDLGSGSVRRVRMVK